MKKLHMGVFVRGFLCFLLLVGLIVVCIIGESRINVKDKKKYSGAQEVINICSKMKGLEKP